MSLTEMMMRLDQALVLTEEELWTVDQVLVLPTPEEEKEAPVSPEGAPVDQGLVLPTPEAEEEEEGGPISPNLTLTDRLLLLLERQVEEQEIVRRLKEKMKDIVIPEWKVKLVQSYKWPKY